MAKVESLEKLGGGIGEKKGRLIMFFIYLRCFLRYPVLFTRAFIYNWKYF